MISVCLPVYAMPVAWLAMESLCNQQKIIQWELLIFEDENYPLCPEFYKKYIPRLSKIGCISVKYKYCPQRTSLAQKWRDMALNISDNSIGVILQGADNYSEPKRINRSYHRLLRGYDWSYCHNALFYSFTHRRILLYSAPGIGIGGDMAICRELAMKLPDEVRWSGVDSWIMRQLNILKPGLKIFEDYGDGWKRGINTEGANRISINRNKFWAKLEYPFVETTIKISDYLPKYIYEKLITYSREKSVNPPNFPN